MWKGAPASFAGLKCGASQSLQVQTVGGGGWAGEPGSCPGSVTEGKCQAGRCDGGFTSEDP